MTTEGMFGDPNARREWFDTVRRKFWLSHSFKRVGVPEKFLPATNQEVDAPHGTRDTLAGAWYGWRENDFWVQRLS